MTIALGAVLTILVVVLVALPFLREPVARDDRLAAPTDEELGAASLAEERDRALAALKDLEFDHRTGKIGDDDYRDLVTPLRQAAAAALKALDELPAVPARAFGAPHEEADQPKQGGDDRNPDQELHDGEAEDEQHEHDQ